MSKAHREAVTTLQGLGATEITVEYGKHLKLRYTYAGQRHLQVVGRTPSCHRWLQNLARDFRRSVREAATA